MGPAWPFVSYTMVALSICVNTLSTAASLVIAVITFLFFTLTMKAVSSIKTSVLTLPFF